ncbi:uncharacterized protein PV06_01349 [Exophiala oligosperma]|uniref:Chitin-binding type-1 domain-containing protein n=1 Tax=Exophiala oligosperma TaxID=215243 RepID=A0A0D2ELL4_9EURO|nr:uncharacterized protein PV06_01349 [Exophiala oligosperma]KIW48784.1 hypothetical protein PV06_01349 [Exophiala oligosperma]
MLLLSFGLGLLATTGIITATVEAKSTTVSTTGNCGVQSDDTVLTCLGSTFGNCCSTHGFCGSNATYCGGGCQTAYGSCTPNSGLISVDGRCGGSSDPGDQICLGSEFGNCCSQNGFCGGNSTYCGTGCQEEFGTCGDDDDSTGVAANKNTTDTVGFKVGMAIMAVAIVGIIGLVAFFVVRRRRRAATAVVSAKQQTDTSTSTIFLEKGPDDHKSTNAGLGSPTSTTRSKFQELDADSTTIQELSTSYNESTDDKKKSMANHTVELE